MCNGYSPKVIFRHIKLIRETWALVDTKLPFTIEWWFDIPWLIVLIHGCSSQTIRNVLPSLFKCLLPPFLPLIEIKFFIVTFEMSLTNWYIVPIKQFDPFLSSYEWHKLKIRRLGWEWLNGINNRTACGVLQALSTD